MASSDRGFRTPTNQTSSSNRSTSTAPRLGNVGTPRQPNLAEVARFHALTYQALVGQKTQSMPELYLDWDFTDSVGEALIRSPVLEEAQRQFPAGSSDAIVRFWQSEPVEARIGVRTLLTSGSGSGGPLIVAQNVGIADSPLVRPLTIRDLVTVLPTDQTGSVEYMLELSRISAAAPTSESTALTGTSGTKPEGGLTFAKSSAAIRTIAEWLPITTAVLNDAPALRAYVDDFLSFDVGLALENQMIAGNGVDPNMTGVLNVAGTQTTAVGAPPAQVLDAIRTARKLVILNGRTRPSAVLMAPDDASEMDLLKDSTNDYIGPGPYSQLQRVVWGMPVIESDAVPAGTAIVGDWSKAILFDRESVSIQVGTINDQFTRNQVTILAELRAAFAVVRPKAFCIVTGA